MIRIDEEKLKQMFLGEYVATPIKNAFNNKTGYWLSKDGCMFSLYMFTVEDCCSKQDFESRLNPNHIFTYIPIFETMCKSKKNDDIYLQEAKALTNEYKHMYINMVTPTNIKIGTIIYLALYHKEKNFEILKAKVIVIKSNGYVVEDIKYGTTYSVEYSNTKVKGFLTKNAAVYWTTHIE